MIKVPIEENEDVTGSSTRVTVTVHNNSRLNLINKFIGCFLFEFKVFQSAVNELSTSYEI